MTDTYDYLCGRCGRWFRVSRHYRIRCAVAHPPGECCHYGEEELSFDQQHPRPLIEGVL